MKLTTPLTPSDRFAGLLDALRASVAASLARGVAGPVILLIFARLRRIADRFAAAAAAAAGGRVGAGRRRASRTSAAVRPCTDAARRRLPGGFGWLVRLVPDAACHGSQLQALLADPEMAALIVEAPQMRRLLRPLCRMLAVDLPPGLRLPPRPRRAAVRPVARSEAARPEPPRRASSRPAGGAPPHHGPCSFWLVAPRRRAASREDGGGPDWPAAWPLAPG